MKLTTVMGLVAASVAAFAAGAGEALRVVPIDGPGLLLPGKTLADVQKGPVSAKTLGTALLPGEWQGVRTTVVATKDGRPSKLHVEMQHGDTGWVKCAVLELTEGPQGVEGWIVATRYQSDKKMKFGDGFEKPDGTFTGIPYRATNKPNANGYGLADLVLAPPKGSAIATAEEEAAYREKTAAKAK